MSGAFKSTTIENEIKKFYKSVFNRALYMPSMIKYWKSIENGVFKGMVQENHLNFAILHLCNLKNFIEKEVNPKIIDNDLDQIMIERGITDMIFYKVKDYIDNLYSDDWIINAVNEEKSILPKEITVNKILLIQKDKEFIESTVLKEPSRREIFPDAEAYLKAQSMYVDFTKKYNNITKTIVIENANDYLKKLKEI